MTFKTELGEAIFKQKYASNPYETWEDKAHSVVNSVCGDFNGLKTPLMEKSERDRLINYISEFKFMPGGRYLWYAGREARFYNNCYLLRLEEDTREEWAGVTERAMTCLMTGGGIGVDISRARPSGRQLRRTGGVASGPFPLLYTLNEVGRNVMQGGSRRSALYGSMNWQHEDAWKLLHAKNWHEMSVGNTTLAELKQADFNFPAPLDMMNISLNYDDAWLKNPINSTFMENVRQAMMTGEPGFSFNFGEKQNETLRNACTEITSEDDSDVCNLGSVNLANVKTLDEFEDVVALGAKFLVCGLMRAHLPYKKVYEIRQKNSRIGLGLMGMHEWLLQRGYKYEMVDELSEMIMKNRKSQSSESTLGFAEVLDTFSLGKTKTVGGFKVVEGLVKRNSLIKVTRNEKVIFLKDYYKYINCDGYYF